MRWMRLAPLLLLAAALAAYLGDAVVFQVRLRHGTAYSVIQVDQFLKTPLKGQKEEYDLAGQVAVTCARSIFPQGGAPACWWVARHRSQWN